MMVEVVVKSFRDLIVWQRSMELVEHTYRLTSAFPREERFALSDQMRRCAVSIPSNIAEGHARDSTKEYLRHVSIALGFLAELETQTIIAQRQRYAEEKLYHEACGLADETRRMLHALQRTLKRSLSGLVAPDP